MTIGPGSVINQRYALQRELGTGGMAEVYLAHDDLLDRQVAVKVLSARYAADPSFVERFRREASAAAGLNHPNIVAVYDRGETNGSYYIVMEYLDGPNLKEVIRRQAPLPPAASIDYTLQILAALGAAHRRDIVHLDAKPQNMLIAEDGLLKVTDFGIARAGGRSDLTATGSVIGTAQYLSPEQARGDDLTAASDCYSAGIVLYELLTGRVPFDGDQAVAVAMKQINDPPTPPKVHQPSLPDDLNAVVMKALAKRPSERYRTVEEFAEALRPIRERYGTAATAVMGAAAAAAAGTHVMSRQEPTAQTQVAPRRPPPRKPPQRIEPSRSRGWWIAALAVLLIAAVAAGLLIVNGGLDGGGDSITIPDVAGLSPEEAEQRLRAAGIQEIRRAEVADDEVEP
ncbi:MAG: Stk1 family PASTA domain-containing Ser/Thr kinase, partial [Thermoleophilia bacterium]|nr:Stk1 family PASTA domain-containing Ser/Thr kinase [Thermoleophilia bacterium]